MRPSSIELAFIVLLAVGVTHKPVAGAPAPFVVIRSQKGGCGSGCSISAVKTTSDRACAAKCQATQGCKCAFYRRRDGYCSMKNVQCESKAMAMTYDSAGVNDVISLCDGRSYIHVKSQKGNCGSACNLTGSGITSSIGSCADRCRQATGCASAFFRQSDRFCSLKSRALDSSQMSTVYDAKSPNDAVHMCPSSMGGSPPTPPPAERCKFQRYTGVTPVCATCRRAQRDVSGKQSITECEDWCASVGWASCRSVTYVPAAVSGAASGKCEVYNETLNALGPFGFKQRPGVVTSSCDMPPPSQRPFPPNPVANLGVAWDKLCTGTEKYVIIPNQKPKCSGCSLPVPRGKKAEHEAYSVASQQECADACVADPKCQCAYTRARSPTSLMCYRHKVPCKSQFGLTYDTQHLHDAVLPCRPARAVSTAGMDNTFVDWFGFWDVCGGDGGDNRLYYDDYDIACGPDCQLGGAASVTTKETVVRKCADRCWADNGCKCAAYNSKTKECRLMTECEKQSASQPTTTVVIKFCCKHPKTYCDPFVY